MHGLKKKSFGVLATVVLGSLGVVASPSSAGAAPPTPMAAGTVVKGGKAVSGALVTVDAVAAKAGRPGKVSKTFRAGIALTNSAGAFTVSVDPSLIPAAYREADGVVNLRITAELEGRIATWNTGVVSMNAGRADHLHLSRTQAAATSGLLTWRHSFCGVRERF